MKKKKLIVIISLFVIVVVIFTTIFLNSIIDDSTSEPMWIMQEIQEESNEDIELRIKLKNETVSYDSPLELEATIKNKTKDSLYFRENWFESRTIMHNLYDIHKKGFLYEGPIPDPLIDKVEFFVLKPNEKKDFNKKLFLKKGFLLLGWYPYFGYYLYDKKDTYVLLKNKKDIYLRLAYYILEYQMVQGEKKGLNIYKGKVLSNEVNFKIK